MKQLLASMRSASRREAFNTAPSLFDDCSCCLLWYFFPRLTSTNTNSESSDLIMFSLCIASNLVNCGS